MVRYDYDMVIIGGGTGGLVTASGLAQLGADVCLIEKEDDMLGGDCLYYGCVPSKTLINTAGLAQDMRQADQLGLPAHDPDIDFSKVMDRLYEVIDYIEEEEDNAERFREMGIDVVFGQAEFESPHEVRVNDDTLTGRRFTVATGSTGMVPPIDGIEDVDYMTNVEALRMDDLPESMIVVGGGPIGLELGQTFHRLGSDVRVIEGQDCVLPKEDDEIACAAHDLLEKDGLKISTEVLAQSVREENGEIVVEVSKREKEETLRAQELLMATGRAPSVEGIGLDKANVEYDETGIDTDSQMRTNQSHIFAVGDVTGEYPFTHIAEHQAGVVIGNIITAPIPFYSRKVNYDVVPWCTFTDPEVARVGMTEEKVIEEFGESNVRVDRFNFEGQDRALIEGRDEGLIKLVYREKLFGVELKGAHIVGPSAGELIHEFVLAMNNGIGPAGISGTTHIYPTLSQSVKRATDEYFSDVIFEGWIPWMAQKYLNWTR
jgi:pyruvate/2-oxoglutarate dehydrogenase complex dihydrolipoamide dehydrogenase (E3) component